MSSWNLNVNRAKQLSAKAHPRDWIALFIIIFLLIVFIFRAVQFGLVGNLQVLAIAMSTVGIVSIGQTLVVLTGGIDLSVGSLMALTGVITAYLTTIGLGNVLGP
ncbi:MAG: ABC transporter permease, partial [Afipia sp.]|nr:ABC transporter permease [Afipia sp.]